MPNPERAALTLAPVIDGGSRRRLPIELDGRGKPIAVSLQPDEAFPDGIVFGDSAKRSDRRTAQIIHDDWGGGVGQDEYTETEGINTATDSTLDTRYQKSLVLPPRATQIGGTIGGFSPDARGLYLGFPNAAHLAWQPGGGSGGVYNPGTTTWVIPGAWALATPTDAIVAGTSLYLATNSTIFRTEDGVAWADLGTPPNLTGVASPVLGPYFLAQYDNKLFVAFYYTNKLYLFSALNYETGTTPTWTHLYTLTIGLTGDSLSEQPRRLFVWKFPPNPGYPALWLHTTHRFFYFDEGALKWVEWTRFQRGTRLSIPIGIGHRAVAAVARRNSNLYNAPGDGAGRVKEYTGNTEDVLGPNERGGLPTGSQTQFVCLDSNEHWLLAWGTSFYGAGTGNRVWAMGDSRGWHCIYSTTNVICGGWVGPDKLYVIEQTAPATTIVKELPFPDEATIPKNATGAGKTYQTGATYALETAWTDGGTPYTNKRAHWTFVDARLTSGASGLPANTTLTIKYMTDRNPTWITQGMTLTSADTFPANLRFAPTGGQKSVGFKRIRYRIEMTSSDSTATPNLATLALHFTRRPKRRYGYSFRVDLRDDAPAFKNASRRYNGYSASSLRTWLLGLVDNDNSGQDDPLVTFEYGGRGNLTNPTRRTVELADMVVTPIEEADSGLGRYQITLRDMTPPSSG